jgi:arylsulfatase A-like enzyme
MNAKPHIVLIICDQLRADAVGFMGNLHVRTPNLDRLARGGVVFENMFVQTPVCMGSRACLLTGRYLRSVRMGGGAPLLDPREVTIAETLQRRGYATGMFGKLHLTSQQYTYQTLGSDRPLCDPAPFLEAAGLPPMPEDPFKRNYGFQQVAGHEDQLWGDYRQWLAERDPALAGMLPHPGMTPWEGFRPEWDYPNCPLADTGTTILPADLHPSAFIAVSAADFFRANHSEKPCFLHVSFVDPHHPFEPPPFERSVLCLSAHTAVLLGHALSAVRRKGRNAEFAEEPGFAGAPHPTF